MPRAQGSEGWSVRNTLSLFPVQTHTLGLFGDRQAAVEAYNMAAGQQYRREAHDRAPAPRSHRAHAWSDAISDR